MLLAMALTFTSITNTEDVRDLAVVDGVTYAATSGGVDVFDAKGRPTGALKVEDGLPSHETWALRVVQGVVFVATSRGLAQIEGGRVSRFGAGRPWHGLPPARTTADRGGYARRLLDLEATMRPGAVLAAHDTDGSVAMTATADGVLDVRGRRHVRHRLRGRPRVVYVGSEGLVAATTEEVRTFDRDGRPRTTHRPPGPIAVRLMGRELVVIDRAGAEYVLSNGAWSAGRRRRVAQATAMSADRTRFGVAGVGVVDQRGRRLSARRQICSNHITSLTRHGKWLVAGTFDSGACRSRDERHWYRIRQPALPSNMVYDVASSSGKLWVATSHGLGRQDPRGFQHYAFGGRNPFGLRSLSVLALLNDGDRTGLVERRGISWIDARDRVVGRDEWYSDKAEHVTVARKVGRYVWIGTEDRGLLRHDGRGWKIFHDGRDLPGNWVTAVDAAADGRAIVGTCQNGVALLRDGRPAVKLSVNDGLADEMVTAVSLGDTSWVGTLAGLSAVSGGRVVASYGPREGLADRRVSMVQRLGDTLWVGTEAGLSRGQSGPGVRSSSRR